MYYHYLLSGTKTPLVFTHSTQAVVATLKDQATHMTKKDLESFDISSKNIYKRIRHSAIDRPFVAGVALSRVIWIMKSLDRHVSLRDAITDFNRQQGSNWFLINYADRTITRFFTLTEVAIYVGLHPAHISYVSRQKKNFTRGQFRLTTTLRGAVKLLLSSTKPWQPTCRRIDGIKVYDRDAGVHYEFKGTRELSTIIPGVSAERVSQMVNRATEFCEENVCQISLKICPHLDIEVTYCPQVMNHV